MLVANKTPRGPKQGASVQHSKETAASPAGRLALLLLVCMRFSLPAVLPAKGQAVSTQVHTNAHKCAYVFTRRIPAVTDSRMGATPSAATEPNHKLAGQLAVTQKPAGAEHQHTANNST